ncbi:hypothetical protein F7734_59250 [Scytonema sp. UIC 10036]|uniref:hypothetical protein n=1 Tax=Scytonema sp. UIC 10036 TaxID=2304196 RepID=UPI0012DABD0D|nr:hypothetical protein [Scytonema sp. UIC 10036]MUH01673.1 hypothetical protein [Scytonema sp. UIC 10036]
MPRLEINELRLAGAELFQDSESFLDELSDREIWGTFGGNAAFTLGALLSPTLGEGSISNINITGGNGSLPIDITGGPGSLPITGSDSIGDLFAKTLGLEPAPAPKA